MSTKKVWYVTGASNGLGLALVKKLLSEGHKVAATSRDTKSLTSKVGQAKDFLPLAVSITNEQSVADSIASTIKTFGTIDVVVNNAGYGHLGTLEELTDNECRENFDVNIFGTLNVIRKVMPHLRERKSGLIINIGSIGGLVGDFAGWGVYCATKFAVAGLTEALAAEVKEFGVHATVVYPGYFRTNFLTGQSLKTPVDEIAEYTEARKLQAAHQVNINGGQPGDPEKAASALIGIANMQSPPLHLFLGSDAYGAADNKLNALKNELSSFEALSKSTDF